MGKLTALELEEGELYIWEVTKYRRKNGAIEYQHNGKWSLSVNAVNRRIYTKVIEKKTYTYYRHWYLIEEGGRGFVNWGSMNWDTFKRDNYTLLKTETMEIEK